MAVEETSRSIDEISEQSVMAVKEEGGQRGQCRNLIGECVLVKPCPYTETDRDRDIHTQRHTQRYTHRHTYTQKHIHTETYIQTHTEKQRYTHTETYTEIYTHRGTYT